MGEPPIKMGSGPHYMRALGEIDCWEEKVTVDRGIRIGHRKPQLSTLSGVHTAHVTYLKNPLLLSEAELPIRQGGAAAPPTKKPPLASSHGVLAG